MRIAIDARFYGTLGKGLGRYTEKLIEHLEAVDQEHEYVIFLRQENFSEYIPKNHRFTKKIAQYAWYGLAEQTVFVWQLYSGSFDLVHFPHFNVPLLYRRKFVVTIHDLILVHYPTIRNTTQFSLWYWCKFLVYRFVIASAIGRARHIITVSSFTKQDILDHYPHARGKISVTYEAADDFCRILFPQDEAVLFARLGLLREERNNHQVQSYRDIIRPYFLYVGNAYPHKNLTVLFAVARAFPAYRLILVGKEDFFYARLKQEVKKAGIQNIFFVGFVTDQELSSLYHFAHIYLFPSLYEGFGLPPLEAMASGTPVIASSRGSLPEILGDAALYFDPSSVSQLLENVKSILENPESKKAMQEKGYHQVAQYHLRDMAVLTFSIYQASLRNKTVSHDVYCSTKK